MKERTGVGMFKVAAVVKVNLTNVAGEENCKIIIVLCIYYYCHQILNSCGTFPIKIVKTHTPRARARKYTSGQISSIRNVLPRGGKQNITLSSWRNCMLNANYRFD